MEGKIEVPIEQIEKVEEIVEELANEEKEEKELEGIDKKLGDLMVKGWIMLSESCPLESCRCPLMRSPDGQKYCVNCESWIFDNQKRKKEKYHEIVPFSTREIQLKHMELTKPPKKHNHHHENNVLKTLHMKLNYLSDRLRVETDLNLIEAVLKDMNLIMDTIAKYKGLI